MTQVLPQNRRTNVIKRPAGRPVETTGSEEAPLTSNMDPRDVMKMLEATMENLSNLMEEETDLVRKGQLKAAAELTEQKTVQAQAYAQMVLHARAHQTTLNTQYPGFVEKIRERNAAFQTLVEANLGALKTARDVTRGIIHNVAEKVGRASAPQTYGYQGAIASPPPTASHGLTLDKSL
ncbi:MAG: flagellar protein FlgN [Pseudomonadota bacterium]